MSKFTIEVINEFENISTVDEDLIEYIPEDAEFEQYEYIEIEEAEDTKPITTEWQEYKDKVAQGTLKHEDDQPKTLIIKLETDSFCRDFKDRKFKCSNRKCKRENISFETQNELDVHNLEHVQQITTNECPICNKMLANQNKLKVHMETRHIPKNFFCDNCGKIFRSKDNLRLHMSHHRKHFIVECRACKKTYKSMQSLRYHLRQHFEHHQCETCGTVFEHKKLLVGHIAAKHNHELMMRCRFCTRMFSRSDVRDTHEKEIHKNGATMGSHFKCNECECAFDLREDLMSHKILNHYSGVIHTCEECGKSFKKKSLLDMHMHSHKEKTFQCDVCKMMFTFVTGLSKHRKLKRCRGPVLETPKDKLTKEEIAKIAKDQLLEITVNPIKKPEVDLFSDMNGEIVKLEVDEVKKKPGRKRKAVEVFTMSPEEIKEEELELEGYVFDSPGKKKRPAITVRTMTEDELEFYRMKSANETITSSSGRIIKRKLPPMFTQLPYKPINIPKRANIPYECDKCGMELDTKLRLVSHLNSHNREQKRKCTVCSRTFCNLTSLKKHSAAAHRDENPFKEKRFKCELCPKRYQSEFLLGVHQLSHDNLKSQKCPYCIFATNAPNDLKNHIKLIHQATRDFSCTVEGCGKAFKRRCDMMNHQKSVHSKIKVYVKCPTCDVIVLEKGLQSHMINRHSEKALNKPFVCGVCGKAERYEKNLQRHYEAVHAPANRGVVYACGECDSTFYRRRELTAHSFDHFTGVIHQCEECGNKYKSKKELTNHLYSHRFKEWPCPLCNVVFQTKSGRAKHIRKHDSNLSSFVEMDMDTQTVEVEEIFID